MNVIWRSNELSSAARNLDVMTWEASASVILLSLPDDREMLCSSDHLTVFRDLKDAMTQISCLKTKCCNEADQDYFSANSMTWKASLFGEMGTSIAYFMAWKSKRGHVWALQIFEPILSSRNFLFLGALNVSYWCSFPLTTPLKILLSRPAPRHTRLPAVESSKKYKRISTNTGYEREFFSFHW